MGAMQIFVLHRALEILFSRQFDYSPRPNPADRLLGEDLPSSRPQAIGSLEKEYRKGIPFGHCQLQG
jgi:hypothetical protein